MAEYIEREEIIAELDELISNISFTSPYQNEIDRMIEGMERARDCAENAEVAEVVPVSDLKEFAEDVLHQFGYKINCNGGLHITAGGLSTLEWAFSILGWEDPHPFSEGECEWDGCHECATCGTPTPEGYKRVCFNHYELIKAREEAERNARMDGE